jgi:hypothetical protein
MLKFFLAGHCGVVVTCHILLIELIHFLEGKYEGIYTYTAWSKWFSINLVLLIARVGIVSDVAASFMSSKRLLPQQMLLQNNRATGTISPLRRLLV